MTDSALRQLAASGLIPADVAARIYESLLAIHDELFELDEAASMDFADALGLSDEGAEPAAIAGTFLITLSAGFA